jgi:hypothetical protein
MDRRQFVANSLLAAGDALLAGRRLASGAAPISASKIICLGQISTLNM